MSYEKVKSIRFDKTNKQVFVTSSSNNVFPLHFTNWECQGLTRAWQSKGYDEMMKRLLESIVNGDLQFYSGKFREFRSYTSRVDIKKAYPELSWDYISDELKKLPVVNYHDWRYNNPNKFYQEYENSQEYIDYMREYDRLAEHRRNKIFECYQQFLQDKEERVPASFDELLTHMGSGLKIKFDGKPMYAFYHSLSDCICQKKTSRSMRGFPIIYQVREKFSELQNRFSLI